MALLFIVSAGNQSTLYTTRDFADQYESNTDPN
jgi:hypothetical protein